jgi:glutamate-1-semialdehyde 2,1-aminomutase
VESGQGAYLLDVDGRRYIDFALAWGPLILGHAHPAISAAVRAQLDRGHMFGAQHELEALVAERIVAAVPCADLITFASSGTEAAQVAFRLARAYTGRPKVLKFEGHYHGWSDGALISYHPTLAEMGPRGAARSVPGTVGQTASSLADVVVAPWNDLAALEAIMDREAGQIAAVVMEPVLCNSGVIPPAPGYLAAVRALTEQAGSLLLFDEVITGFRVAFGGAQELYNVVPDLAIYAKAVAAGFPLGVIAGRREVMNLIADGVVTHSGTYNGNPICMAAAMAATEELRRPGVYEHLHGLGAALAAGARGLLARHGLPALVHQVGPVLRILFTEQEAVRDYRALLACDDGLNAALTRELRARGILVLPDGRWYISVVHTQAEIDAALGALDGSLAALRA